MLDHAGAAGVAARQSVQPAAQVNQGFGRHGAATAPSH